MGLLKGWAERIANAKTQVEEGPTVKVTMPLSPKFYTSQLTIVENSEAMQRMVEFAQQRAIAFIGISFLFDYSRPGVAVGEHGEAYDPISIKPLYVALAMVEFEHGKSNVYRFVVNLGNAENISLLTPVLQLPVAFIGHDLKTVHFCLWKLKLPEPSIIWDTRVAQVGGNLGRNHINYSRNKHVDVAEQISAQRARDELEEAKTTLREVCRRHGVEYVQRTPWRDSAKPSSLTSIIPTLSMNLIHDLAEDASAVAAVYLQQTLDAVIHGTLHHFEKIEMPWVRTNARIEWNGVKIDAELAKQVAVNCEERLAFLQPKLAEYGIDNVRSPDCLKAFFKKVGLLELFKHFGQYSFKRKTIGMYLDRHEAMPLIYAARHILDMQATGILNLRLIGDDGRQHPFNRQLGTDTGRQTTMWSNILGVSRVMRPLVIPELGFGVGEVDLSQIEVFIVAAEYNDETLIQICNAGDVYVGMVKKFHRDIPEGDLQFSDKEFKAKHGEKRDRMKILTLGIIYGSTPYSIAPLLKISVADAERVLADFMAMFPALQRRRLEVAAYGALRGHVATVTGLRRYRGAIGAASNWERNWMTNHPIQGSAAVVFKIAGNRLDRMLQEFNAKLIIAFHDAYVFEAPLEHMQRVAQLIKEEMIRAVQEVYPMLRPRADINIERPECWNKDGKADSIKQWLAKLSPAIALRMVESDVAHITNKSLITGAQREINGMRI